ELQLKHYADAQIHAARGDDKQALQDLQAYFDSKATEQGEGPYRLLEEILVRGNKEATLIEQLEKLHEADPHNHQLAYFLASRYVAANQQAAAQEVLESVLTEQLTQEELVEWLGGLEKLSVELAAATGDESLMKKIVTEVRKRIENEKESTFDQNLAIGVLASDANDPELAAECFRLAVAGDSDQKARVYEIWGLSLERSDNYSAAVKVFRRAIDEQVAKKNDPRFHFYLSRALAIEDQFDEALEMALYAVDKDERNTQYRNGVAWIHYLADRRAEAITAYQSMLADFDSDRNVFAMREYLRNARYLLSVMYAKDDNIEKAAEMLEQVLDEFPDDVQASNDLGYLWTDEAVHLKRAHRMILYAVESEPDNIA
ncbi:MAG: tetratricopeptide repeat protein, partial [Planctomycetales bacterium]